MYHSFGPLQQYQMDLFQGQKFAVNSQDIVSYFIWYDQKPRIFKIFASLLDNTITCTVSFKMWLTVHLKSLFISQ